MPEPPAARGASQSAGGEAEPDGWRDWLQTYFPDAVRAGFSPRHEELWRWGWGIQPDAGASPFVACWPRGGGKSTTMELIIAAWAALGSRRYVLYICETQEQADDHVQNVAALLESPAFGEAYPHASERLVSKFGASKGWRRNRLRTAGGFTLDALGLDTAARGMNLEGQRPDGMIVDDVDGEDDSEAVTAKKHRTLTRKILPAAAPNCVYAFVQNRVHDNSLMAQCLDGRADFFGGHILSGPFVAVDGLETIGDGAEAQIVAGTAAWPGQSLETCQDYIRKWGLDAFLSECQHQSVGQRGRYLSSIGLWDACADPALPPLGPHEPAVLAVDAGESSDAFALALVTRHPSDPARLALRLSRAYVPEEGVPLDFDAIERDILDLCTRYAVVEWTYDRFLLGQIVRRIGERVPCPLHPFSQAGDRLEADKALRDAFMARTLAHDGTHNDMRQHLDNANAKVGADGRQVRIVKRSRAKKVDLAVTLSMARARAALVLPEASWLVYGE